MSQDDLRKPAILPDEILAAIHPVRGQRVMLDADLARLYGVETRTLNQAVRRHPDRFPADFMLQLTPEEWANLKSQIVISSFHGGRRKLPYAFTEQGVAMLSSVLNSDRAIAVNVEIMRAFVRYRHFLASHEELAAKLREIELRFEGRFGKQDQHLRMLFEALRQLRDEIRKPPPAAPKRRIGFHAEEDDGAKGPKPQGRGGKSKRRAS